MSARGPAQAVVCLPVLDLRREPAHAAELGSQLLLGETVHMRGQARDTGWVRVRNDADEYEGWVRTWGLVPASAVRAAIADLERLGAQVEEVSVPEDAYALGTWNAIGCSEATAIRRSRPTSSGSSRARSSAPNRLC